MNEESVGLGRGRVLALDYGSKRTGAAMCDPLRTIVQSLPIFERANTSDGIASISKMVLTEGITRIVVGLPVSLNGSETKQTARCRSFAARLAQHVDVPVELHDERFTSRLADHTRVVTGSGSSRDSLAASHLLQSWMEVNS